MRTATAALAAALLLPPAALAAARAAQAAEPPAGPAAQRVRVHLVLSRSPIGTVEERERIRELMEELLGPLEARGAGRLARDAWPDGACDVTLEGPDARAIWAAIEAPVRAYHPLPGSYAALSTPAGEERIPLDAQPAPAATPRR